MIGLDKNSVEVRPYEESWATEFEKEKAILEVVLKDFDVQILHVGSTAIPGLSAKPIIDIAVGVKDEETLFKIEKVMIDAGYDVMNSYQEKGEILARKGLPECRTHYIHMQLIGSEYWNEFVYFKRYMLEHPEEVKVYEKLKKELSVQYASERKKYKAGKNEYITGILQKALNLYGKLD